MHIPSPLSGPCDVDDGGQVIHGEKRFGSKLVLAEVLPRP